MTLVSLTWMSVQTRSNTHPTIQRIAAMSLTSPPICLVMTIVTWIWQFGHDILVGWTMSPYYFQYSPNYTKNSSYEPHQSTHLSGNDSCHLDMTIWTWHIGWSVWHVQHGRSHDSCSCRLAYYHSSSCCYEIIYKYMMQKWKIFSRIWIKHLQVMWSVTPLVLWPSIYMTLTWFSNC